MPRRSWKPGDFKLKVGRSRTGLGLFALEPIGKDACITEYVGRILTDEEYAKSRSRYLFAIGRKVLEGATRDNVGRYINHSCAPNCQAEIYKGRVFVRSLRRIAAGEELTYDYGKEYFDAYLGPKCRCLKCQPEPGPAA